MSRSPTKSNGSVEGDRKRVMSSVIFASSRSKSLIMADQLEGKSGDGLSSKRLVADRERTSLSISSIRTFARADACLAFITGSRALASSSPNCLRRAGSRVLLRR